MQAGVGQLPLERIPATFPGDDRKRVERSYLRFAGVGVQYALTILILTLAGIWLDNKFETSPLFLIIFLLLAFVGATWSLVQQVLSGDKKDDKP
jgi:F0F1-type ATP synthase assembly protein I